MTTFLLIYILFSLFNLVVGFILLYKRYKEFKPITLIDLFIYVLSIVTSIVAPLTFLFTYIGANPGKVIFKKKSLRNKAH